MSCCTPGTAARPAQPERTSDATVADFLVPTVHCAGCIARIEDAVSAVPDVLYARLNLSTRRLSTRLAPGADPAAIIRAVEGVGYACRPFDARAFDLASEDKAGAELLTSLAVAGFAAANVMLLSVSVWSGADGETRQLFHWLSALIALPAAAIAGRPFYRSAFGALRRWRLNMDVPISLAVILACALSVHSAATGGDEAFFDASVMLLFFLLIGRYLDHRMRAKARDAVTRLLSLWSSTAMRFGPDGVDEVPVEALEVGDRLLIASGARLPADGVVLAGVAELDCSALTGESEPRVVERGAEAPAGALALSGPITVEARAVGEDSYLSQAIRLMEQAEAGRAGYARLADKAAQVYAPLVHLIAFATFAYHAAATGGDWRQAIWIAVSVLIITCPCALGLAVPAVQTVASGVLFRAGVLLKDGAALERLAEADRAAFDKTGALTEGAPKVSATSLPEAWRSPVAALAAQSRHPLARGLVEDLGASMAQVEDVVEVPGGGLSGVVDGAPVAIGSWSFIGDDVERPSGAPADGSIVWAKVGTGAPVWTVLEDRLRPGAGEVVAFFRERGFQPTMLSGDRQRIVARVAKTLGMSEWHGERSPLDKIQHLEALKASGARPLMLGDGVNDGPALAAAHVSIAPASASDIGRAAADMIIVGDDLRPMLFAWRVAKQARRLALQNFALAAAYNAVAIPVAFLGYASPLAAAIAMSTSSILVTANALRLAWAERERTAARAPQSKEALA